MIPNYKKTLTRAQIVNIKEKQIENFRGFVYFLK